MAATDPFARELAKQAIHIALETRRQQPKPKPVRLPGRCQLCGAPTLKQRPYCHAHTWAG